MSREAQLTFRRLAKESEASPVEFGAASVARIKKKQTPKERSKKQGTMRKKRLKRRQQVEREASSSGL